MVLLLPSLSSVRLVKPDRGERSDIWLLFTLIYTSPSPDTHSVPRSNIVRRVANSSPVKSLMFAFGASRRVKLAISSRVIGAPFALPRRAKMAARRFASGMSTLVVLPPPLLPPLEVGTSLPKSLTKIRKSEMPIAPSLSRSYFASYFPSPRRFPNWLTNAKKSAIFTMPLPSKSAVGAVEIATCSTTRISMVTVSNRPPRLSSARTSRISELENAAVVRKRAMPIRPLLAVAWPPKDAMPISTKVGFVPCSGSA